MSDLINMLVQAMTNRKNRQQGIVRSSSPTSTAGTVGNADAYNQYAIHMEENGQQPLDRMAWLKQKGM